MVSVFRCICGLRTKVHGSFSSASGGSGDKPQMDCSFRLALGLGVKVHTFPDAHLCLGKDASASCGEF